MDMYGAEAQIIISQSDVPYNYKMRHDIRDEPEASVATPTPSHDEH